MLFKCQSERKRESWTGISRQVLFLSIYPSIHLSISIYIYIYMFVIRTSSRHTDAPETPSELNTLRGHVQGEVCGFPRHTSRTPSHKAAEFRDMTSKLHPYTAGIPGQSIANALWIWLFFDGSSVNHNKHECKKCTAPLGAASVTGTLLTDTDKPSLPYVVIPKCVQHSLGKNIRDVQKHYILVLGSL